MTPPITRWVEPCAGMLAVALRLRGGANCLPPIAYMGGKRGYAAAILDGLGVASGSGCRDLWVADAGPAGAFWRALAEGRGPEIAARLRELHAEAERDGRRALWDRLVARPETHTGEDAAAWLVAAFWSFTAGIIRRSFSGENTVNGSFNLVGPDRLADRIEAVVRPVYRARVYPDARAIPIEVEGRTVVYLDPPYAETTGYAADLPREAVRDLAMRWHEAGAEVLVSEREPVVSGWRSIALPPGPNGRWNRTGEYLTLSPSVRWQSGEQTSLWPMPARAPGGSAMTGGVGRRP